jgi:hypothetical protein
MNTTPINDPNADCQIERADDKGKTYMCGLPAAYVWFATPDANVKVCRACKRWLETLESLGRKIA